MLKSYCRWCSRQQQHCQTASESFCALGGQALQLMRQMLQLLLLAVLLLLLL
jgi:hypothetical protein